MRIHLATLAVLALAACEPAIPDSGKGVGFGDYETYSAQREAQLSGRASGSVPAPGTGTPEPQTPLTATATPANPRPAGISDEQDFSAVSSRESIESDAARIAANRAQYQQIEPTALPSRTASTGSVIVDFALTTSNRVGEPLYRRSGFLAQSRFDRNCGKFPSPDKAQEAFLKAGGPERDSKGIDPDGDGFACYWDPTPFRQARLAAAQAAPATALATE